MVRREKKLKRATQSNPLSLSLRLEGGFFFWWKRESFTEMNVNRRRDISRRQNGKSSVGSYSTMPGIMLH